MSLASDERAAEDGAGGTPPQAVLFGIGILMALAVGLGLAFGLRLQRGGGSLPGFTGGPGGDCGDDGVLAVVNGQAITEGDVAVELAVQKVLQAQMGNIITDDPAQQAMFRRELLSQVVDQTVLQTTAQTLGHAGDPNDLAKLVASFQIDPAVFSQKILEQGVTAEAYQAWLARQSGNARYVESLGQLGNTPEKEAERLFPGADVALCQGGQTLRPAQVGKLAPDFELQGPDGRPGKLSDYRGKAVILNFWATWCAPCKIEMPHLARSHQAFQDKLTVLAVSSEEAPPVVQSFLAASPLPFPILLDQSGDISRLYRVRGLPTTYFIGPDGTILEQNRGAFATPTQLQPYVDRLLASVK